MTQLTYRDIPAFTERDNWTAPIESRGYTVRVRVDYDECMGMPWDEHDGHGIVSKWRPKDSKAPGEMILAEDRGLCLFYDFAATVRRARREGWDAEPYGGTPGEKAHRAALEDFEYCRRFAAGDIQWIVVTVEVTRDGREVCSDSVGGIESEGTYWREHAAKVAEYAIAADIKARKVASARAASTAAMRRRLFNLNPISMEV